MRMYDIIAKKRDGGVLTEEEIRFFVEGFTLGDIPDDQASALCMAIYLRGMTAQETAQLTAAMAHSGDMVDLSAIAGIKVDKHSTGGVGDKTTLVVAPVVAACGVKVAKMSGRGLGHTGGTLDKIEAIPGASVSLTEDAFLKQVNEIGLAVIGQTGNLAPADKKLYALRDVTATVSCLPLIASSIMSKKLASGADCILLDVKTGNGAFMKTLEDSIALAEAMVSIGEQNGRRTAAMITDMDTPLGHNVGNSLEVAEAVETLQGRGPADLTEVCLTLAAKLLELAGQGTAEACRAAAEDALHSGRALAKLREMVAAQGGDVGVIDDPSRFRQAAFSRALIAHEDGVLYATDTESIGFAAVLLGAGREQKEDAVDPAAGLRIEKKAGDIVKKGDVLATLYTEDAARLDAAEEKYRSALTFKKEQPVLPRLICAFVDKYGVQQEGRWQNAEESA
ncbi:MAG: pyrimidine-nucleoside phosphorylase [Ruthenibacterium sp.]